MIDPILRGAESKMTKSVEHFAGDLATIRTGRANPALIDKVMVPYYGTPTPLNQLAQISAPEPRLLVVQVYDKSQIGAIEKALRTGDQGLNPTSDGQVIRVPIPPLTEERRKEFVKIARKYGEECKVAIRKGRHDAIDMLGQLETDGDASADEVERGKKKVEDTVTEGVKQVDSMISHKEKDILEV